ncbi:MAG: mandelate racemase/muconate lactonizing enzyme family protein [Bryobacteraceae bacterium]|nr:mandelate racemase/muconate lactonizing enzyme family protein [Bryobacteraceae bacterium]
MKIREIRAVGLRGRTPEGGWSNELRPEDCVHTLVAVLTGDGATGWGSVFTSESLVRASLEVLRPLYTGENALEPRRVSEKLHQHTFWQGRGGAITHTISGIDIALWDLLGKATGQPVGRLLGGRYRDRVRPYASLLMKRPEEMPAELDRPKQLGFRAFKIGWGPFGQESAALDEAIVRAARDCIGPDAQLMVDAGASNAYWPRDYKWALHTAGMLAAYNVTWFEEPIVPDDLDGYVALRRAAKVAISGGEVLTRRQTFQPWIERGAFDIVQPDVTKVGGISEEYAIAASAFDHGIKFVPHGWNTAVGVAADLQLVSAFAGADLVEYISGSPFVDDLVEGGWRLDAEGMLEIPSAPGLGIDIDLAALAEFSGQKERALRATFA